MPRQTPDCERKLKSGCFRTGRGGNVIATFGPPFRVEYVMFLNNTQTNNPVLPDSSVVKNPPHNHRIEGQHDKTYNTFCFRTFSS